jgi:serine/threonine protein kinase
MPGLEGQTLHHYHIQRRLARGGMSEIYLASDTQTSRMVAIKVVNNSDKDYCERFQREVAAIATLSHDHILPAFDYGEYDSWCYMVTPYIEDGTLDARLAQGPLSVKEAGRILAQLASALQFAHNHGILHRDIKPSNVLMRDGEHVYLTDFGLVKKVGEEDHSLTLTGYLIGTPEYMAPELADGCLTTSSDIYALGILLYQMLTGRVPFKGSTSIGTYLKHIRELPVSPSVLNPAIPPSIERVVLRALEKDPQQRFGTASEFSQAYQQALRPGRTLPIEIGEILSQDLPVVDAAVEMLPVRKRHSQEIAMLLLASVVLVIIPLLLGFSVYSAYGFSHPAALVGASATFDAVRLPAFPPQVPGTSGAHGKVSGGARKVRTVQIVIAKPVQQHQDDDGGQGHDHGHKHKHGHGHGDD